MRCFLCEFFLRRCPAGVVIIPEVSMADVVEGKVFKFSVFFKNAAGRVLASPLPSDAAVTEDRDTAGTVSVNADGSNGVFTAGGVDGPVNLTATAGGFTSDPLALSVVPDPTPSGVVIYPV